jgi:hypothetical protein
MAKDLARVMVKDVAAALPRAHDVASQVLVDVVCSGHGSETMPAAR